MLVNLSDLFASEGKVVEKQVELEMDCFKMTDETYKIVEKQPIMLVFRNMEVGKVAIEGTAGVTIEMACDRCLKDVKHEIMLKFSREVFSPENSDLEEEEQSFVEGYYLNVETLVSNEILMNWPMKILCQEDCKGICNVCGRDLNTGECDCDTFVPDPRMAGLRDIFSANKEV